MSSYYTAIKADSSGSASRSILYYEKTTSGIFDGEITLSGITAQEIGSELDGFRIVSSPTKNSSSYRKVYITPYSTTYATATDFGMLTHKKNTPGITYASKVTVTTGSGGRYVVITDQYGTHTGAPSGHSYYPASQFIAVKHASTTSSTLTYNGVKVTLSAATAGTIISSGGTTEGLVTTFAADYTAAVVIQCGTSGSITVEYLYKEKSKYTIKLDAGDGYFSSGSSTYEAEVTEGDSFTFPSNPVRDDGVEFKNWGGVDAYVEGYSIVPESDMSLDAVWEDSPDPTPSSRTDYMVRSSSSDYLIYSASSGALVYAL